MLYLLARSSACPPARSPALPPHCRSPAGADVVPTFTTSNDRLLLLLADGAHGMLRVEDAERLQGMEVGHTRPCWPIQVPGVGAHRGERRDANPEAGCGKRWDLLGGWGVGG